MRVAIVVLRVVPDAYVMIARGTLNRFGWSSTENATQFWPEEGFVVAKVSPTKAGEAYAVVRIRPEHLGLRGYGPGPEQNFPVFTAIPGRVNYVGGFDIISSDALSSAAPLGQVEIAPVFSEKDRAKVVRFLADHYPGVRARVIPNHFRLERIRGYKPRTMPVVVPIPI